MKRITLTLQTPYVGLRPFGERDAVLFFGRDQHVRELLMKLEAKQRFIAVLGASGSGKSSLVRAGLVPALHRGALMSAGYNWNVCIFKPGDAPLTNLAEALTEHPSWRDSDNRADAVASLSAALAMSPLSLTELYRQKAEAIGGQALLLVVDQFEEIFRYRQKNVDEAESFINLLLRSSTEDVPIYVVLTMRSDFLGNLVAFFGLPEAVNRGLYLTPRLGPDQLKSIIASPLSLVGGEIDPVLASRLVNTLEGEDELPIMEHALLRMWNRAQAAERNSIRVEDFETVCAPHKRSSSSDGARPVLSGQAKLSYAIDNHASEIYDTLSSQQQRLARQVFLALVERREGRDVRRPRTFKQLLEEIDEQERDNVEAVIDAFQAEQVGFLRPSMSTMLADERVIDISHESLFRQWHLFQQWLSEEELDAVELKEWQQRAARQKEGGGWLDEQDGERAERWRARVHDRTTPSMWATRYGGPVAYAEVDAYIKLSIERVQQAKAEQARLEREAEEAKTRGLELEAQMQREAAERAEAELLRAEKEKKQAQDYAATSRRKTRLAIAVGAIAFVFFVVAAFAFLWANQEKTRAERMARDAIAGELTVRAETMSKDYPDQSSLLALAAWKMSSTAKAQGLIRSAWGDYSHQHVLRGHEDGVESAQFAPDGKTVVTASRDKTARLWDVASGKELHVLRHEDEVRSAQFAPDGKTVVTASSYDGTARLWDVASGKELHVLRHDGYVTSARFAPNGKTVVTASWGFSGSNTTARLWDTASGKELHVLRHEGPVASAQFAPDGKQVVTASLDKTARLWDVASGKELHVLRHEDEVRSAQFAPDGKTVVTASSDGTARLWDVASGKELHVLRGHEGRVERAQFAPDGKTVVTESRDQTARLWDVASGKELHVLRHDGYVESARFAPDGKTVVTASSDGTARLWRCEVCRPIVELAAELQKTIGRDLTDEERRRYGVPEAFLTTR